MTNEESIALALAVGAAARVRPNNWAQKRPEVAAYLELVDLLSRSYRGVDAQMMEPAPGSEERRRLLAEQLKQSGAAESRAALRLSRQVLREAMQRSPQALVAVAVEEAVVAEALTDISNILEVNQRAARQHA